MLSVSLLQGPSTNIYKGPSIKCLVTRVCISDVREEGGLATLEELREKFGAEKVELQLNSN